MSLPKLFERIFWHNNTTPAVNQDNLNAMSKGLSDVDDRVIGMANNIYETIGELQQAVEDAQEAIEAAEQLEARLQRLTENPPYIGSNGNWYVWDTTTGDYVDSGIDASITVTMADVTMLNYGVTPYVTNTGTSTDPIFHLFIPRAAGVSSISKTSTSGRIDTYTMTFQDGATGTFNVTNGADGNGVSSISKTGTSGLTDTYTITFTDGTTTTYTVKNGAKGEQGAQGLQGPQGDKGDTGNGIASILKILTVGLVDTYAITYTDSTTSTFDVTNGKSAYASAQDGGYSGTESQFNTDLGNMTTYASNAQTAANNAASSAEDAEAFATGKRGGSDVGSSDPAYHNNASYFADQADTIGQAHAETSESYANGQKGGVDVGSSDPAYHNNSLYYSQQSASSATDAASAKTDAEAALASIGSILGIPTFTVDFTTGELIYTKEDAYTFSINQSTGNLEWEVAV